MCWKPAATFAASMGEPPPRTRKLSQPSARYCAAKLLNGGDARVGLNAGKDGWANAAPLERGAQGEEALVRALAAAGDDEGARGALARKDVGELQQAARAAKDSGRAPRQEPRAEGEAALEGAAGESLERHGPTSLS